MTIGRVGHHLQRFGYSYRRNEKKNKLKAEQETAQPTAARFNKDGCPTFVCSLKSIELILRLWQRFVLAPYFGHFVKRKTALLTVLSNFHEFLKNKNSLEFLNMIFRIRLPKGIFKQNMSDLPNGSLTGVS